MRINHNISAQLANVNLKKADNKKSTSLERLSSGYKINKAADDSAGMAISNKMRAQIRALDQASRNSQDGQSIIETAEGALGEVENILQRIRELSVQAANDTYTLDDREAIQCEVNELLKEIDRVSGTTEFNGTSLLDGSASRAISSDNAQIKALSVSMEVAQGDYGLSVTALGQPAQMNIALAATGSEYSVSLNGETIEIKAADTDETIQKKLLEVCDSMGIKLEGTGGNYTLTSKVAGSSQKIIYKDASGEQTETGTDAELTLETSGSGTGFRSTAIYAADGNLISIVDNDGFEMHLEASATGEATFRVYDAGYMTIQIGANEGQNLNMNFPEVTCLNLGLKTSTGEPTINMCTQHGATHAISALDDAIKSVSAARSIMGAYQNRLETTTDSLDLSSQNITEAMSRISDTDMAVEMTEYTQQDVLSQAATSMLAQANSRPQQIMSLLQG